MVKLMLDGFGGDQRKPKAAPPAAPYDVACYHVNARLSKHLEDIGDMRPGKYFLLLFYCIQAIWCRFRYGVDTFYYVPAPGKRSALYRDWLVMLFCRPFFNRVILHWHAAGLAKWLETCTSTSARAWTHRLMKEPDLSIVLSQYNRADAKKLFSKKIQVVSNGIPDPCPAFARDVLPRRHARLEARRRLLAGEILAPENEAQVGGDARIVDVLFLALCTREKGLFDAMAAVALANKKLAAQGSPISLRLTVAGTFPCAADREQFDKLMAEGDVSRCVRYSGFVTGDQKNELFRRADLFCFPTSYGTENQPVSLLEAMAFGLPVLTTRWRSLPEILPAGYTGLVDIRSPEQLANGLIALLSEDGEVLRAHFLKNFSVDNYLSGLAAAFHNVDRTAPQSAAAPVPTT